MTGACNLVESLVALLRDYKPYALAFHNGSPIRMSAGCRFFYYLNHILTEMTVFLSLAKGEGRAFL